MHSTLTLPAAVERAAIANRHGWGPQPGPADLAALATAQAGLHAARLLTPYVTAHTRLPAFRAEDLRCALSPHGTLIKVRCVRRTLHLWPHEHAADAHTATLRLRLGATLATARRIGLSRKDLERTSTQCQEALAGGPLAYRDLQDRMLKAQSVPAVEAVRLGIKWAWESGQITCRNTSPSLHREQREFALIEHAHPTARLTQSDITAATARLIRYYLRAYAPASIADLLWWTGLSQAEISPALATLRPAITHVRVKGLPGKLLTLTEDVDHIRAALPLPADHVRLLAFEDPSFKGYFATRDRYRDAALHAQVFNPIGEVRAAITLAGRIVGTWNWDKKARTVQHNLLTRLSRPVMREVRLRLDHAEAFLSTEPG
ncbi:DNA glycosylase AlkZ-like family protein [Streptomyces rimosus]|uniref:DNA glycosylase AlkZ-like family protein n=1 Tax=Streptomyces rimosus TaxID=1927 RepID=UPI0004BFD428|nr:crosslink repair DNA glycosylase YcaQ family protein [Streptomyces rimosus]